MELLPTTQQRMESANAIAFLQNLNIMEDQVRLILQSIPGCEDEMLLQLFQYTQQVERWAFVIRGAAACEIQARVTNLSNSGAKDASGSGVLAQIERLGQQFGISQRTILRDAQIYRTLILPRLSRGEDVVGEDVYLTRGHYEEALGADDPESALSLARDKMAGGLSYSTSQMRAEVHRTVEAEKRETLERTHSPQVIETPTSAIIDSFLEETPKPEDHSAEAVPESVHRCVSLYIPVPIYTVLSEAASLVNKDIDQYILSLLEYTMQQGVSGGEGVITPLIAGASVGELVQDERFRDIASKNTLDETAKYCTASLSTVRRAWREVRRGGSSGH